MKENSDITEISESVEKSEAPECKVNNIVHANQGHGTNVLPQCATTNKEQISQKSDEDVKHIQLSDEGSGFAGFASPFTNSSEQNCILKQSVGSRLKNKEIIHLEGLTITNTEQQISSLHSMYGSIKNEVGVDIHPDIKRRKMLNELKECEQSPVDQIIEIYSNSTTSSDKYKRKRINSKHQLRLLLHQQTLNSNSHNNKYSTETTSDFPVSSPSNPHDRPGAPQKNTLPADSFERSLALLTAQTPQMSLEEKINCWKCDLDLSDVEDVGSFDDLFKQHEELKQKVIHGKRNFSESLSKNHYDFSVFREKVLPRMKASTSFKDKMDRLSNCSVGALSAQRRLRAALEFECKKRQHLELFRGNRAVTPTFTSSSENEMVYSSVSKPSFNPSPQKSFEQKFKHLNVDHLQSGTRTSQPKPLDEEVLELNARCKNKVLDSNNQNNKTNSQGLIQMRLDFAIQNKSQHLHEKRNQLFKTSTLPQDYLPSPPPILLPMPTPITLNTAANSSKTTCTFSNANYKNINVDNQFNQHKECNIPMQKSLRETDQNCSAFSTGSKTNVSAANFHQQYEFCNYLGLTGMSTANAVANAVAELAKCNLTRRSLRVRRLKQQEKKDNSKTKNIANADELVETLKSEGMSVSPICAQKEMALNYTKNSEDLSSKKSQKLTQFESTPMNVESKTNMPVVNNEALAKEPEIKILCKISNTDKEKSVEKCSEEPSALVRQTRYVKPDNSNDTSTCPRSSISDVDGEISSNPTPNMLQNQNNNFKSDLQPTPTRITTCSSFKNNMTFKSVVEPDVIEQQLYNKFKKYLDASRKVKPSIYIVQALHNVGPQQHLQPEKKYFVDVGVETSQKRRKCLKAKHKTLVQSKRQQLTLLSKQKKKERLRKLLALATSRQIRNRKFVFVKKIKSTPNTCEKATKKRTKSNQSEHCSTVSLSKSHLSNTKSAKSLNEKHQGRKNKLKRLNKTRVKSRASPSPADTSNDNPKTSNTIVLSSTRKLHTTPAIGLRRLRRKSSPSEEPVLDATSPPTSTMGKERIETKKLVIENETVVVSSTTNSYDEATLLNLNNSPSQASRTNKTGQVNVSHTILTKDHSTQSAMPLGIHFLNAPSKELPNPVKTVNGRIDYLYYEMDVLIVVQEKIVSFWKYFKLINVLAGSQESEKYCHRMRNEESFLPSYTSIDEQTPQWLSLGECRRLTKALVARKVRNTVNVRWLIKRGRRSRTTFKYLYHEYDIDSKDMEISTSYANRICVHNSIPIYIEMRCREIPRERRDCNLLSMYINVYYFNDEEMVAKMHSIQLDAVQGLPSDVIYTTITESRYFVMSWPQENILGKPRSGLCKYSLTPNLDTLASIRDFKHMRHRIRYLECSTDDKLIGFGDTQLTIWDHRSGDVLMNYDFNMELGQNLGSIYFPSLEIGQNSMLILFQYIKICEGTEAPEVLFIACSVSHTSPSHRILKRLKMPSLAFNTIQNAVNTGDNVIITAENNEEIWINCTDPTIITRVPPQCSRRFYPRGKSQIIELTSKTLMVDSFANHVLKLAAEPTFYYDKEKYEVQV